MIEDQSGTYVISYDDADRPRVTSVRRIVNGTIETPGSEDEAASFEYLAPQSPTCDPETDYGETIVRYQPEGEEATETYCYTASGTINEWSGPEFEPEEEGEGTEEVPEVPAETCYEDPEFLPEPGYCGEYNPSPNAEEELEAEAAGEPLAPALSEAFSASDGLAPAHFGIADGNKLNPCGEGCGYFDIFDNPKFKELKVVTVRRIVPWNLVHEGGARLKEVETWVQEVKQLTNSKGERAGEPLVSFETPTWYECAGTGVERYWLSLATGAKVPCTVQEEAKAREAKLPETKARVPTVAEYIQAITEFREHPTLSEVKLFTATNEPNEDNSTATEEGVKVNNERGITNKPSGQRAGKYWRKFDKLCEPTEEEVKKAEEKGEPPPPAKCLVGTGDFTDVHMKNANNGTGPGHHYFEAYQKNMGAPQKVAFWAWHAYADGQEIGNPKTKLWGHPAEWWHRFDQFRKAVNRVTSHHPSAWGAPAHIWLTEQGVIYYSEGKRRPPYNHPMKAERILRAYVADGERSLVAQSSQIKRFYYYQMRGSADKNGAEGYWDSGLLDPPATDAGESSSETPKPRNIWRLYHEVTK